MADPRIQQKFAFIPDKYHSIGEVQQGLRQAGLEGSNLIVAVDFTKSNTWTGERSFGGKCLHHLSERLNPYQSAIAIIGQTLAPFDDDNLIPCFGFGDVTTHDTHCFSFNADGRPCRGFQEVMQRYAAIVPHIKMSGPTSFAPVIETACRIVEQTGGQFHTLIIIADGQVTRDEDTPDNQWSPQERPTVEAIAAASNYPLSIVMVGVGDGPWDQMKRYDNMLPRRNFDNFQFVDYTGILARALPDEEMEAQFALAALMEIPEQYKACRQLKLVGRRFGSMPPNTPLPPPPEVLAADQRAAPGRPY